MKCSTRAMKNMVKMYFINKIKEFKLETTLNLENDPNKFFIFLSEFIHQHFDIDQDAFIQVFGMIMKLVLKTAWLKKLRMIDENFLDEEQMDNIEEEVERFDHFNLRNNATADDRKYSFYSPFMCVAKALYDFSPKCRSNFWNKATVRKGMTIDNISIFKGKISSLLDQNDYSGILKESNF
jgi:hypothetical protein